MSRKKSIRKAAEKFKTSVDEVDAFLTSVNEKLSKQHISWSHDYAVIRLYRDFEKMTLTAIVGVINNDTTTLKDVTDIKFPKHLTNDHALRSRHPHPVGRCRKTPKHQMERMRSHCAVPCLQARNPMIAPRARSCTANAHTINVIEPTMYVVLSSFK